MILFFLVSSFVFSQNTSNYTLVKAREGEVKIPGEWKELQTMDDSGQVYLVNKDYLVNQENKIIIAVAKNLKRAYPFFQKDDSDFENVKAFYQWDSDYRRQLKFITDKLKENEDLKYVIWKYKDPKTQLDNVFLFGSSKDCFLNLLVYTDKWTESEKVAFLEKLYQLNK